MSKKVMGDFDFHHNRTRAMGDFTMGNDIANFFSNVLTKVQQPDQPQPPSPTAKINTTSKNVTMKYVTYIAIAVAGVVAVTFILKKLRK